MNKTHLPHPLPHYFMAALLVFAALPASASWFSGWGNGVAGSGNIQVQQRAASDIHAIQMSLPGKVEIRQGDKESIQVETDDNLQALVETVVEHGNLKIRPAKFNSYPDSKTLNIVVYLKNLNAIEVSGSGTVNSEKLAITQLKVNISGSGDIHIKDLQGAALDVSIGGSGSFSAAGLVPKITGSIGGSGSIQMAKLEAQNVRMSIGGSGQMTTWVKDTLNVSVGGSGDVYYYGDPKVSKSIGGSGTVSRKGATPL